MEGNTCYHIRKLCPILTRTPDVQSLRHWEVQPAALSALFQHYDLPLRCFTFQGFQLAPTLEEYERLLAIPFDKSPPYLFRGHYPSWASVTKLFKVPELEVLKLRKNRNGVEGIPKVTLEERLQRLQEEGDWLTFVDVYGLLVYGIMLFPQIENYMDLAAVEAFLGNRDWGEHPVVVVDQHIPNVGLLQQEEWKGVEMLHFIAFLVVDCAFIPQQ
ncbi:hypothetical protein CR513_59599, partial [Mucuna pruriens]